MIKYVSKADTGYVNLSPDLFRRYAIEYLQYHLAFKPDTKYSPVPYFLICRAIELSLKAKHLENKSRKEVKGKYGHNLVKLYDELPIEQKILEATERDTLVAANTIYDVPNKGFEYVSVFDAVTGFKSFPDLAALERIADKLLQK